MSFRELEKLLFEAGRWEPGTYGGRENPISPEMARDIMGTETGSWEMPLPTVGTGEAPKRNPKDMIDGEIRGIGVELSGLRTRLQALESYIRSVGGDQGEVEKFTKQMGQMQGDWEQYFASLKRQD